MGMGNKITVKSCQGCANLYWKEKPTYYYSSTKLTISCRIYEEAWCKKYRGRIKNIRYCKGKVMPDGVSAGRENEGRE